jgi:5-formyltetrahydrofolate cyclo-ligase
VIGFSYLDCWESPCYSGAAVGAAEERERLRRAVLARRDQLAPETRAEFSRTISERFWSLDELRGAATIHVSLSVRSEVSTADLVTQARRRGIRIVVPVTITEARRLVLTELVEGATLVPGPFGISEPHPDSRVPVPIESLDAVVVPGLAFDPQGNRLGWGAGYYDRLLAGVGLGTPVVALAFECQIVPSIPSLGHDVRMSAIVTEQRVIRSGTN